MAKLKDITEFLDSYLRHSEVQDYPGAWNGLQMENGGTIKRIVAAVDACEFVINKAAAEPGTLLLVHHGLFWTGVQPVTGSVRRKWKTAMDGDLAIYSSHLPLDMHPEVGNNALLCKALGFKKLSPFLFAKGQSIGWKTKLSISRDNLQAMIAKAVGGRVHLAPGGSERVQQVGVCTGGSGSEVAQAAKEGVDTFIVGEGPHHTYTLAEELGVNLFYAGHYATETFGVKALAAKLTQQFRIPWQFLDHPTGL